MARERPELGEAVVDLVVLDRRARQGRFQPQALLGAGGRGQRVVEAVAAPADLRAPGVEGLAAERVEVVDDALRGVAAADQDLVAVDADQAGDGVGFGQRDTQHDLRGAVGGRVLRGVEVGVVELAPGQVVAQRDAVVGEVGVGVGEVEALLVVAALRLHRHAVAAAEEVVLRQLDLRGQLAELRIAQAEHEAARGGFLQVVDHVDLVVAAGHRLALDVDGFEVAQALQADLGAVDRGLRIPGAFELAHLAAQDFVAGARVALEDDPAHVDARARHHLHVDADGLVFAVDVRDRIDLGEGVADVAQGRGDRVGADFQQAPREDLLGLDDDQLLDVFLRQDRVAGDLHAGDLVLVALGQAGGEEHVLAVGADRDLGRVDGEIDVAAVEVVGVELFQIAGELLARVLVVAAVPAQPVVLARLPAVEDVLLLELVVADQVDVADLGRLAFLDVDGDVDAVAVQPRHGRGDLDVVLAAVVVLARQVLGDLVQRQPVEGFAFGQADVLKALEQVVGLDVLVAAQGELVDRRTLGHGHHQNVALAVQMHVFEETGLVQRADGVAGLGAVHGVAALDRQVGEDRAGGNALQAVDADVADGERTGRRRLGAASQRERIGGLRHRGNRRGRGHCRGKGEGEQAAIRNSRHHYVRWGLVCRAKALAGGEAGWGSVLGKGVGEA